MTDAPGKLILESARLRIRQLTFDDAAFVLRLLNEPSFLQNIGDRGVRTRDDARNYILTGPMASYAQYGFGLFRVELKDSGTPIGMCGLLKRDYLDDADIGFAFLPEFWSKGYAYESAAAMMAHGRESLGLKRIVAITAPDNHGSMNVLRKIGLEFERMVRRPNETEDTRLFTPRAS
jgi:RimJ/RimL family protein N-acetyltransferase